MNETPINNQKSRESSAPLGSVTDGRLRFMRGASNVTIHTDPSTADLYRVRFEGLLPSVWVEGGDVAIEYPWTLHPFDWCKRGADVVLNGAIPWEIGFNGGLSRLDADLSGLRLVSFSASGGVSRVELLLAEPSGKVPLRFIPIEDLAQKALEAGGDGRRGPGVAAGDALDPGGAHGRFGVGPEPGCRTFRRPFAHPIGPGTEANGLQRGLLRDHTEGREAGDPSRPQDGGWVYDGIFLGPTIEARSERRVVIRQWNELPVPVSTHLHGGKTPPESDGYPADLILPKGHTSGSSTHPEPGSVGGHSQYFKDYVYPNEQRAATLWYHDHRMDFTGPQVYKGLASMYILRDEVEDSLALPAARKRYHSSSPIAPSGTTAPCTIPQ
jgi:hypothetical protein